MAIDLVGYTVSVQNTTAVHNSIEGSLLESGNVGNLLIAYITNLAITNPGTFSPPAGWTTLASNFNLNGQFRVPSAIAYKIREETQDLQFTVTESGADTQLIITEWSGNFDPDSPLSTDWTDGSTNSTTRVSASITPQKTGSVVLAFAASRNGASSSDDIVPSGMSLICNRRSKTNSGAVRSAIAYMQWDDSPTGDMLWEDFTSSAYAGSAGSLVINRSDELAVISVNEDNVVNDDSNNTLILSDSLESITNISIRDDVGTNLNANHIAGNQDTWYFSVTEAGDHPYWGNCLLVVNGFFNGSPVEISHNINFLPRIGFSYTTIDDVSNIDGNTVGNGVVTISEGSQIAYDSLTTRIFPDATCYTIISGDQKIDYVNNGILTQFTLRTGEPPTPITGVKNRVQTFWMK